MLKILQINLHHPKDASATLLLLLPEPHYDVALIQDPRATKGSVCWLRTPIYTLSSHATGKCRACILIRKYLNFFFLNTFSEVDLVAIAVGMDGDWIRLGSVYLAYDLDIPANSCWKFPNRQYTHHTGLRCQRPSWSMGSLKYKQ